MIGDIQTESPTSPAKAVHSWSLFRTLGRYVAPGSMPSGALPEGGDGGLPLLELPAELGRRGYGSVQLCHFYLSSREVSYLTDVRAAFDEAGVEIECLLIDDGDLTHPTHGAEQVAWISAWMDAAEHLAAPRVRVPAGKLPPSADTLQLSAGRLTQLAHEHPEVRLVTENWHALLPDAASVNTLLDLTGDRIGFLIDLGNWTGPDKYRELAAVAGRAETCQAKAATDATGAIDEHDYRSSLNVLRNANYTGPLAMVYAGADDDEWTKLDQIYSIIESTFAADLPNRPPR
jgi:sugar phosphate isomerase/epimerase